MLKRNQIFSSLILFAFVPQKGFCQNLDSAFKDLEKENTSAQSLAYALISQNPARATDLIAMHIEDSNKVMRIQCLKLIHDLHQDQLLPVAIKHAQSDSDLLVREFALIALSAYKETSASEAIKQIALDPHGTNRVTAIRFFSFTQKKDSIPALSSLLGDSEPLVRANAARELARYSDARGRVIARNLLNHADGEVRFAAIGTLRYVGDLSDIRALEHLAHDNNQPANVQFEATTAIRHIRLIQLPKEVQQREIEAALTDDVRANRRWASSELVYQNDDAAKTILKKIANGSHKIGKAEASAALKELEAR